MVSKSKFWLLPVATLGLLAGCATTGPGADVTRFHLGGPIPADTIALQPIVGSPDFNLEYRTYADAVLHELTAVGFRPADASARSAYIAILKVEQTSRDATQLQPRSHLGLGFGVGGGGGGYHGGGFGTGLSVGGSIPIGKPRVRYVAVNTVALQIKRRSDETLVWEGRASETASGDASAIGLPESVPRLAHALLAGFPGPTGTTVRVPFRK